MGPRSEIAAAQRSLTVAVKPAQSDRRQGRSHATQRDWAKGFRPEHVLPIEYRHAGVRQASPEPAAEELAGRHEPGRPS